MNIISQKIHAAPSATFTARAVPALLSSLVLCCVFLTGVAQAQAQQPPRRDDQQQFQAQRYEQPQRTNDTRIREQRPDLRRQMWSRTIFPRQPLAADRCHCRLIMSLCSYPYDLTRA